MYPAKRILVPMDFTSESQQSLDWAVMTAKQTKQKTTLYLLYVMYDVPEPAPLDFGMVREHSEDKEEAMKLMASIQKTLPGTLKCVPVCKSGNPAKAIVSLCREKKIDLVIMTTHGRQGLSHLLHPSVAEKVVRSAPCPVLVLHLKPPTRKKPS